MKLFKYTEEELRNAVKNSVSIRDSLVKLKISPCGGNYQVFKKAVKYYNINTEHFLGQGWNKGKKVLPKQPIEKYLNNELSITSFKLKDKLIKGNLKLVKCEQCGLTTWQDKSIPLELHHINGNNKDNRLINLQLLCPNCHALTDNYRNRK